MIYLGNEKILSGGKKNGISIIQFDKEYKNYNFLLNIDQNKTIKSIIQINNNNFISLGEIGPISKLILYDDKNKIEKVAFLKVWQNIINICDINKKNFAYQTNQFIAIVNINTFKENRRIKYESRNSINKYNDKIIGVISDNQHEIVFFDIEKGTKVFEIKHGCNILGFLKSKRAKDDIITILESLSDFSGYGFAQDYSKNKNKWEGLSSTIATWTYNLRHISEMDDFTILISGQDDLYVLIYQINDDNNFLE